MKTLKKIRSMRSDHYVGGACTVYGYEFSQASAMPQFPSFTTPAMDNALLGLQEKIERGVISGTTHIFQGSAGGTTTATAAAFGFYTGGPMGIVYGAAAERANACFQCHVTTPVYDVLRGLVAPDSTGAGR